MNYPNVPELKVADMESIRIARLKANLQVAAAIR